MALAFLFLPPLVINVALVVLASVIWIKVNDQAAKDKDRVTYVLTFPSDLKHEHVVRFIRALSGTLKAGPMRIFGVPSIVFEMWVTKDNIFYLLRVSPSDARFVLPQLRVQVPGIHYEELGEPLEHRWRRAVEVGMSTHDHTLLIPSDEAFSATIRASTADVQKGEILCMQWVVTPALRRGMPAQNRQHHSRWGRLFLDSPGHDDIKDRREKLAEPNLQAVLRLAVKAKTDGRAAMLVSMVRKGMASSHSVSTRFVKRLWWSSRVADRLARGVTPITFPGKLNAAEMATLVAWPIGNPQDHRLPAARSRRLPAPESVRSKGRVFAVSNFPGSERRLAVSVEESCKHYHIVGRTGSGKTTLMANLLAQDMAAGRGVVCIEAKGDLFKAALDYVPMNRIKDVIVMDLSDPSRSVGFNILAQGNPQLVASEIQHIFSHTYRDLGVRLPEALYHSIITLCTTTTGGPWTFLELMPLMCPTTPDEVRLSDAIIRGISDPYIAAFWQSVNNMGRAERDRFFDPLRSRVWQLNARPEIRRLIGQSSSTFDMRDVIANRKILLVNLAGLSGEAASLIGALLINNLWNGIREGIASQENPVILALDEWQKFVHMPIEPDAMMAEARSFGLSLHLAHQGLDQLTVPALKSAVMNNAVNKIVFQRGTDDARAFAAEFGSLVTDEDFKRLGKHEIIAKVSGDAGISPPITGVTLPPYEPVGYGQQVVNRSRAFYGRSAEQIEQEIIQRRKAVLPMNKRPNLGDESWET